MPTVQFLRHTAGPNARPANWHAILSHTHTHTYSGRSDHGGTVKPPELYQRLAAWTRELNIAALGMGSPFTPETARSYDRFDGDGRVEYYGSAFDQISVRGDKEIAGMLAEINKISNGSTHFFLDNETPKGRYGHLWWVDFALDYPAWHDYDQDFDRWMVNESVDDCDEPMPYTRRPYRPIVAAQRAKSALANWAHPTSWWHGSNGQFITNIASEMPAHLIADGFLDGLVVMGYHAFRPEYQNLWFSLLDRGYRIPAVAEMDCGLSNAGLWEKKRAYLTLVHAAKKPTNPAEIASAWQSGRLIVSSGVWVELTVDGAPMGVIAPTSKDAAHQVVIQFGGESDRYDVEIIGHGGEILWTGKNIAAGITQITVSGSAQRSYLLTRVFALKSDGLTRDSEQTAVSNPVYLHPHEQSFEKPATTLLSLEFSPISCWRGGTVTFETANGEMLGKANINGGPIKQTLPASGRFTLHDGDSAYETHYLINANQQLQNVQSYLYRGRFLRDFPTLKSGQLSPEVWRFEHYQQAMQALSLVF